MPSALVKPPSPEFAAGLTSQVLGAPDLARALDQHAAYCRALESLGLELIALAADHHADSCFVEDMAVVAPGFLLATRSPVRQAEQPAVGQALQTARPEYKVQAIEEPGFLEGGDVLRLAKTFFVGLTERTDRAGFEQFRKAVEPFGYQAMSLDVKGLLHLKTGVSRLDDKTVLVLPSLAETFQGLGYRTVVVDPEDWHAANTVAVERGVIMPAGHSRVASAVRQAGFEPVEVDLTEFKKQDGGASCLSILLP